MDRLFKALLGLGSASVDAYQNVRSRFFGIVAGLFLLLIFEWMMNYWGYLAINAVLYFILLALTVWLWSHPKVIAGMSLLEKVSEEKFAAYLAYIILWLSIVSMFLATLPFGWYLSFREAFGLFLFGMVFLSAIGWMAFHGWFKTTMYKRVITSYAVIGFLVCVWILIPASFKYWLTGMNFYGPAGTSETAKAFAKIKRSISIKEDQLNASVLKKILTRIEKDGKVGNLTKEEKEIWEKAEKDNLPSKLGNIFSDAEGKKKTRASVPGESWSICWQEKTKEPDCADVTLKKFNSRIEIEGSEKGGRFIFKGDQTSKENNVQGKWNNANFRGTFSLDFSPNFQSAKSAKGCLEGSEKPHIKVPMWMSKNG